MQPLPDKFTNLTTSTDDEVNDTTDYESIEVGDRVFDHQRNSRPTNQGISLVMVVITSVLLSLIINIALIVTATDKPFSKVIAAFGLKNTITEQADSQQVAIEKTNTLIAQHSELIAKIDISIKAFGEYIADIKSSLAENDSKIKRLESGVEELANEINRLKVQRVTPKPITIVKPKEPVKPQIFVTLVSIRSQGGSLWVTLREGLDTSPLMAVGDEWRAVKVISADTNNKTAQVQINGTNTVIKL